MKRKPKIICPYCSTEYLPCEIFYPFEIEGKAHNILRDLSGKIVFDDDNYSNYFEEFICEECNNKFYVEANLSFNISKTQEKINNDDENIKESELW